MTVAVDAVLKGLQVAEHELLLFAAFWLIVSAIDELAIDLAWLGMKATGRLAEPRITAMDEQRELSGKAAVLVPAWHEAEVIEHMIRYTLGAWPQRDYTLYIGCYANDAETMAAAVKGCGGDRRARIVVHDAEGPTTKADCLNRLYAALSHDEARRGFRYRSVILHDAEDMPHPAELSLIDRGLSSSSFVQLPVRPELLDSKQWIAGHYADEFTEAHAKAMVVRDAIGAGIPAAGVGCGFAREKLAELAAGRALEGGEGPFASECLTEDYELGLSLSRGGSVGRFLRCRDQYGELVATRAFFPATLDEAVRQKTRWVHGIAFQGWDRLGWSGKPVDIWMSFRDRRGPLAALVLAAAYCLLIIEAVLGAARLAGWQDALVLSPVVKTMLVVSFTAFAWRALWRFAFVGREYGLREGVRAVLRIPVANVIAIMAGRRALVAYFRSLRGSAVRWDKTVHGRYPSAAVREAGAR